MNKDCVSRMKPTPTGVSSSARDAAAAAWEVRPGGMLVQKRNSDSTQNSPNIRVRVKYGASYHQVSICPQASFGELKKMVAGATGLHPQDQKLIYKEKERDSKAFLDISGVKNGSKIVLIEDELSRERRCVESRKNAKTEKASMEIADIKSEVDKLAKQVGSIELEINGGKKVVDTVLSNMIELLMTQLIKLDAITADGDIKLQRRMQVKRVQRYIEALDVLKIKNCGVHQIRSFQKQKHGVFTERVNPGTVVVTTKWETF